MAGSTSPLPREHPAVTGFARWAYGGHGRYSDYWRDKLQADPHLKDLHVTVDLVLGGDVRLRAATQAVHTVGGNDGLARDYLPVLAEETEVAAEYAVGEPASAARSFELSVPNALVDAARVVARGRILAGVAEVALQVHNGDWDERVVLMRGDMDSGVTFGDTGAGLVTVTVSDPKETADLYLPPWTVDETTWPSADESVSGYRYPVVMNRYDDVPALNVVTSSTTPRYLAAYGWGWTVSTTSGVRVNGDVKAASSTDYPWTTVETTDGNGVPVTQVRFTGGTATFDGSESVHVTLTGGRYADNVVDAVQHLARWFTALGPRGLNADLFSRARARLGKLDVRVLVNASGGSGGTRCLEYVEGELLQSFPMISMVWDRGGYGPVVTDRRFGTVMKLQPGVYPCLDRASDVQESPKADIYNSFVLRYAYGLLDDEYTAVTVRTPVNNVLCGVSRDNVGERIADPIESNVIFSGAVAEYVADWLVEHRTLPSYYVEYDCLPIAVLVLRLGDNVALTDDEFGWTDVTATVEKVSYARGHVTVGLRVWWRFYALGGGAATGTAAGPGGN